MSNGTLYRHFWLAAASFAAFVLVACSACSSDEVQEQERVVQLVPIEYDQRLVLASSVLEFRLQNTDRVVADTAAVTFDGTHSVHGRFNDTYEGSVERLGDVGDIVVRLPVAENLWRDVAITADSSFEGTIEVELGDALGPAVRGELDGVQLEFTEELAPSVDPITVGEVYADELIEVHGSGFVRPLEGATVAVIESGAVTYPDGASRDIAGEEIALRWTGSRSMADFPIDPAVFGVQSASFSARLRVENRLDSGETIPSPATLDVNGSLEQSYLARLSPDEASRGQKIRMIGRGLVGTRDEAGYGMLLRYEGVFTPDDPTMAPINYASPPIYRAPDQVVGEQEAVQNVWYSIEDDRSLSGLGATPGVFEGTITPELFDPWGEQEGLAWQGELRVLPTKQVVYLKYLPAFSTGLEKYGLRNVERDIRDRILEVVRRDYDGINLEFRERAPDDFIDYAVIELGGPDPSGGNAFGYDNTFNGVAKDTGNLFLGDYLGGVNADSEEQFNNPYGGVFLESFSFFSASLNPDNPYASPEFDRIMESVMPALGGEPIQGTEWPDGPRRAQIAEAIHMVGSVIGNTVSHELGHSLGLTYFPEDDVEPTNHFHNQINGPYIMDAGSERPFEERAEINGQGPARFTERNYDYLRRHLPAAE